LFVCCVGSEEGNKGKKRAISQFTSPRQPQLEEEETGRNSYLNGWGLLVEKNKKSF
jgi:hypothetical protein